MRAIIIATGEHAVADIASQLHPTVMLPLLDRPFLQHVVELIVSHGITQIDFVLSRSPEQIETLFGEGDRWGATFTYHLARDPHHPYNSLVAILPKDVDEPILLVDGNRLPVDELICLCPAPGDPMPRTFVYRNSEAEKPDDFPFATGWQWILPRMIADLPTDQNFEPFEDASIEMAQTEGQLIEVARPLSARSYCDIIESQRRVLAGESPGLLVTGREVEAGIWISRNVSFPSSVKLVPPLYLGSDSRIGQSVTLGPNVVVGKGSILDRHCTVRDSLILPGSYVGESLELADLVVDRNRVVNTRLDVDYPVCEDFIIGSMKMRPIHDWLAAVFSRVVAISMLLVAWPLLLLTALYLKVFRASAVLHHREFVRLPAQHNPVSWTVCRRWSFFADVEKASQGKRPVGRFGNLLLELLPALFNIAKGELHFVGVRPRNRKQLEKLPVDWRELVLCSKAGMITEASVRFGSSPNEDEMYSAEAFYAVRAGIRYDFKLLAGWFARFLFAAETTPQSVTHFGTGVSGSELDRNETTGVSFFKSLDTTSDCASLNHIRAFVECICREILQPPMGEEDAFKVVVSVQEVATNVMRHAYHGRSDGDIRFEAEQKNNQLVIHVLHHGDGFDPSCVQEPRFDNSGEGGYGLYIISQYVDDVQYSTNDEDVHCVSLTINLLGGA